MSLTFHPPTNPKGAKGADWQEEVPRNETACLLKLGSPSLQPGEHVTDCCLSVTVLEQIAWPLYDCLIYGTRYHTVAHRTGSGWGGALRWTPPGYWALASMHGGPYS